MNSEELELSLRSEFENYLKDVIAEMKGEVADFQKKIEAELDAQKTRIDEAFEGFAARLDADRTLDAGFTESVVEHLRLSRDEGAKITAAAFAEAEELEKASMPTANFGELKDAINDISSKDSQASILKALITHAANYAPRGAFFIIKSENFTGWKVFGKEADTENSPIRDIIFPTANDTILGKSVLSLSTAEGSYGTYQDDAHYLEALDFGRPDRMYAIPLIARGRGVAVLYADYGVEGVNVNLDALETLVKIAALTVELLASARQPAPIAAPSDSVPHPQESYDNSPYLSPADSTTFTYTEGREYDGSYEAVKDEPEAVPEPAASEQSFEVERNSYNEAPVEEPSYSYDATPAVEESVQQPEEASHEFSFESAPSYSAFDPNAAVGSAEPVVEHEPVHEPEYEATPEVVTESFDAQQFETVSNVPVEEVAAEPETPSFEAAPFDSAPSEPAAPVQEAAPEPTPVASAPRSRLSERHIDLPVEVSDEERRFHTDARRFAKLLVSEIKLYNQETVAQGRESGDLYDRLKEAIDRSREMYDNRVLPVVAAKFDYFHYELVNSLAEGNEEKLGAAYAGVHA
ncbi:MAG: chromosome segregation ATPase-like protein [Acidobacteria bacterium OLB17]|nr:MAG: chromosome segregation ATPase-like protein [Acidobacteria bacterium OLB17]MCZ2390311.1 hypothetical protein [Acidobacteriota bacterium]